MRKSMKRKAIFACLSAGIMMGAVGIVAATPVQVSANTLVSQDMVMDEGAGLYLDEVSGLRFSYTVENYDENANYGMLIVPCDYLDDAGITDVSDTTKDYIKLLNAVTFTDGDPIVEENLKPDAKGVFSCCVTGIYEYNYAREFFGIGFVKTGDSYVYATQSDNVRSVFEVANLAANKLNYGVWDESNADDVAEKKKLSDNEDSVINPFIEKAWAFAYDENATPTVEIDATYVNGETTPVVTLPTSEKGIELKAHFNVVSIAGTSVAKMQDGKVKGVSRGQTKVSAKLGSTSIYQRADVTVFQDETELSIYKNYNDKADFFTVTPMKENAYSVMLDGGRVNSTSVLTKDSGYVAFPNTYTLNEQGTYIDCYFTGNNMPNVEFFGSSISGNMFSDSTNTGYVVTNGNGKEALYPKYAERYAYMADTTWLAENVTDGKSYVYGGFAQYPHYFSYGISDYNKFTQSSSLGSTYHNNENDDYVYELGFARYISETWKSRTLQCSKFSMFELMKDETKSWHYVVGMYKTADNKVYLDAKLYEVSGESETLYASYNPEVETLDAGVERSGYIVVHAALKGTSSHAGENYYTKLTYTAPYTKAN